MELLTVREVAQELRVSPMTVLKHIASGKLRAVRAGRSVRVERSAVEQFVKPLPLDDPSDAELDGQPMTFDDPIWKLVGLVKDGGPSDMSVNHDRYLADSYIDTHER